MFLGASTAPVLEAIVQLKPDLIILRSWDEQSYENIRQIAPTFALDISAVGYWRETLLQISKAVGKEAATAQFLVDYDATAKHLAAELAPVAAAAPNVLFLYSYAASDGTMILGKSWTGVKPFELLQFNVMHPKGIDLSSGAVQVSPEIVNEVPILSSSSVHGLRMAVSHITQLTTSSKASRVFA